MSKKLPIRFFGVSLLFFICVTMVSPAVYSIMDTKDPLSLTQSLGVCSGDMITNYWAVLIACSGGPTYEHQEIRDRNDIQALKAGLVSNGWDEENILVLLEEQATSDAILNTSFAWLHDNGEDEDDVILFYFSGHGHAITDDLPPVDEPDGKDNVLHPWDADFGGWHPDTYIVDDDLAAKFDTLHSQNIAIVFHTCQAGGLVDGTTDFQRPGRVVVLSCGKHEASVLMLKKEHWLFSYYLIKGMEGIADRNKDTWVSAEELWQYTKIPVFFHSMLINFYLSKKIMFQRPQIYDGWPSEENNYDELKLINIGITSDIVES